MTNTLHAHVARASADCDGPQFDEYIMTLSDEEVAHADAAQGINDFSDLMFKARVLDSAVSFHPDFESEVRITADGFRYHEPTEEGYRQTEVTWCEDDCDTGQTSHRDVYAEMMGY